jgi:hypothetical protein
MPVDIENPRFQVSKEIRAWIGTGCLLLAGVVTAITLSQLVSPIVAARLERLCQPQGALGSR